MSTARALPKLVRDRIPEILRKNGNDAEFHTATSAEYVAALSQKLVEEAEEFRENPSVEEAADVLEALVAWCKHRGIDLMDLEVARMHKRLANGGFDDRVILHSVTYSPASDMHPARRGTQGVAPFRCDTCTGVLEVVPPVPADVKFGISALGTRCRSCGNAQTITLGCREPRHVSS